MAQQLKRWESPRRKGRNDKGRGGSARQRQKQKQLKALRLKLKQPPEHHTERDAPHFKGEGNTREEAPFSSLFAFRLRPQAFEPASKHF